MRAMSWYCARRQLTAAVAETEEMAKEEEAAAAEEEEQGWRRGRRLWVAMDQADLVELSAMGTVSWSRRENGAFSPGRAG